MKIKEKILKEELLNQRENENIRYPLDEYWFRTGFDVAWDKFLAEVGKILDNEISLIERNKEKEFEKVLDHSSRYIALCNEAIDTLNRIKQKLGIK